MQVPVEHPRSQPARARYATGVCTYAIAILLTSIQRASSPLYNVDSDGPTGSVRAVEQLIADLPAQRCVRVDLLRVVSAADVSMPLMIYRSHVVATVFRLRAVMILKFCKFRSFEAMVRGIGKRANA